MATIERNRYRLQGPHSEQQEKIKACKTADKLEELIRESGEDLTEEELLAISGGEWDGNYNYSECSDFGSDGMNWPSTIGAKPTKGTFG